MLGSSRNAKDIVVCDINGLRDTVVSIWDVMIKEQCLVENNACSNAMDAAWMLNIRNLVRNTQLRRSRHGVTSGKCRVCPVQTIYSDSAELHYSKKLGKASKASKASKRDGLNLKIDDATISLRKM
eukprot:scaffold171354_cov77-Attheya_sp.AAC.5